ncbi:transmembrane proteins 14c protein [Acanthamoeba castellanii str. Neff]|uniref:Transmembrane proteins 14c protein n=1 Tax=Acanthamoeba castellanii (strain ATCC 30010 / Neff) TaxID=1257118 RepID=L8GTF8_ACACF|nr:transmembrane proteins 14c protein [Acanthamoeba castellanii str. Neff]ELR16197.1 transmembrane proteins 14c protein [Acanthamoeba castellanii str. Neff]
MAQVWTLVVGGLVAAGGAMGYAKARSVPSLVAGVTCGALYGLSTLWMEPYQIGGNLAAVVISIILAVAMGRRFLASGKVMPGVVAGLSVLTGLINAYTLYGKY